MIETIMNIEKTMETTKEMYEHIKKHRRDCNEREHRGSEGRGDCRDHRRDHRFDLIEDEKVHNENIEKAMDKETVELTIAEDIKKDEERIDLR